MTLGNTGGMNRYNACDTNWDHQAQPGLVLSFNIDFLCVDFLVLPIYNAKNGSRLDSLSTCDSRHRNVRYKNSFVGARIYSSECSRAGVNSNKA